MAATTASPSLTRTLRTALSVTLAAHPRVAVRFAASTMVMVALTPLTAYALKRGVDAVLAGDGRTAAGWVAVFGFIGLVGAAQRTLWEHVTEALHWHGIQEVRRRVMRASLDQPGVAHLEDPVWADATALVDAQGGELVGVVHNLIFAIGGFASLAASVVLLAEVHPLLAVPVMGAALAAVTELRAGRARAQSLRAQTPDARLATRLHGLATQPFAARQVRMLGLADHLQGEHRALTDRVMHQVRHRVRTQMWASALSTLLRTALISGGLAGAVVLASRGRASPGDVVLAVTLLQQAVGQMGFRVEGLGAIYQLLLVGRDLVWLLDHPPTVALASDPVAAPDRLHEGIRLQDLTFAYPGTDATVLRIADLHLPAGATVALVGDNGAGKTTLVKLLLRLYDPTAGRLTVDGIDLSALDLDAWRARCTTAFQDHVDLEFEVRESVGVGDLAHIDDRAAVTRAVEAAGAAQLVADLPAGLDTPLGRTWPDGADLSRGQWQRLALARAAMRSSPLLVLLDEPTADLDARAEHEVFERYAAAAEQARTRGGITLLVSHRFSTVRMADLIVVLDAGEVAEVGTHDALLAQGGTYAELYRLQSAAYAP